MTVEQVAINAKAIRNAAARLEAKGYDGDATAFCESLIVAVLADGYARIDPPGPDGIVIKDPTYTVAKRIRDVRRRRGWSAQRLAQECARHGMPQLNRDVLANIESGRRKAGITLEELFTLALALNVAPVHLMVDTSDGPEATTAVGHFSLPPKLAREWICGRRPIAPAVDPRVYFSEVPPSGWDSGNLSPQAIEELGKQAEALQQLQANVRGFDQSGPETSD